MLVSSSTGSAAGAGPGVRVVRDGLHRGPVLDRADAHRRGNHILGLRLNVWTAIAGLPRRADLLPAGPRSPGVPDPGRRPGDTGPAGRRRRVAGRPLRREAGPRRSPRRATGWSARSSSARTRRPGRSPTADDAATTGDATAPEVADRAGTEPAGPPSRPRLSPPHPAGTEVEPAPADDAAVPNRAGAAGGRPPTGTAERHGDAYRGGGRRRARRAGGGRRAGPVRMAGHPPRTGRPGPPGTDRRGALAQRGSARCARSASAPAWTRSPRRWPTAASVGRMGTGWCSPAPRRPTGCRWWCTGRTCTTR